MDSSFSVSKTELRKTLRLEKLKIEVNTAPSACKPGETIWIRRSSPQPDFHAERLLLDSRHLVPTVPIEQARQISPANPCVEV